MLPASTAERSRELRRNAGEPEKRLKRALREAFPDARFRHQVPLGRYHADFCSHGSRLVLEIDGDDHAVRHEQDAARTRFFNNEGYAVQRFGNEEVMRNLDGVLQAIAAALDIRQGTARD